MLDSEHVGPINLGNPIEMTVAELASKIIELTGSDSTLTYEPLPTDDPTCRRPDISRAAEQLGGSRRSTSTRACTRRSHGRSA